MSEFAHIFRRPPQRRGTINFVHIPKNAGTELRVRLCGRRSPNFEIVYNGHATDGRSLTNQLIVLREPVERFASAVRYALQARAPLHRTPAMQHTTPRAR
jgi:hypothetical protein